MGISENTHLRRLTTFTETTSVTVLLRYYKWSSRRHKRTSGRSVSKAAPCVCMNPALFRSLPNCSKVAPQTHVWKNVLNAGVIFSDMYRIMDVVYTALALFAGSRRNGLQVQTVMPWQLHFVAHSSSEYQINTHDSPAVAENSWSWKKLFAAGSTTEVHQRFSHHSESLH